MKGLRSSGTLSILNLHKMGQRINVFWGLRFLTPYAQPKPNLKWPPYGIDGSLNINQPSFQNVLVAILSISCLYAQINHPLNEYTFVRVHPKCLPSYFYFCTNNEWECHLWAISEYLWWWEARLDLLILRKAISMGFHCCTNNYVCMAGSYV